MSSTTLGPKQTKPFLQCSESRRFVLPTTSLTYALGPQISLSLWSAGKVRPLLSNVIVLQHSCWYRIDFGRYVFPGVNVGFDGETVIELIKKDSFSLRNFINQYLQLVCCKMLFFFRLTSAINCRICMKIWEYVYTRRKNLKRNWA